MKHLFFLGIAGHAMGGMALAAKNRGFQVSGLDETGGPPMSDWLDEHNLEWTKTYNPELLKSVDTVVISGQHGSEDHPVIKFALEHGVRVVSFAELLGELTKGKHVVAVAGTHGKTTTSSLITWLLESAGRKPDFLIGIRPLNFDASSRLDGSDVVVVESDEYKASTMDNRPKFDYYHPNVLVLTSVEHDHPDVFPTEQDYIKSFKNLVSNLPKNGRLVACAEEQTVMQLARQAACPVITYGQNNADYTSSNVEFKATGLEFDVAEQGKKIGRLQVGLYGEHNVLNSLAATAVALKEGLSSDQIKNAMASFKGATRRFNLLSSPTSAITVIDDYAHHPTEAKSTIQAARLHFAGRRLVVVYRPHTYSRTQTLLGQYTQSFNQADRLYITDVEPAREAANQRIVTGQEVVDVLPSDLRNRAEFEPDRTKLVEKIMADSQAGDVVLCMTVSGYNKIANELAEKLK